MQTRPTELIFQAMVEATPNAVILVNKEGRIAYANFQTEKLFGYSRAELVGQLVELLIPERFRKQHPNNRGTFFVSPETRSMGSGRELFAIRKDKTEFPVEIGLNPVVTADGTLVLASIIDITERKKLQNDFQALVEGVQDYAIVTLDTNGNISSWNAGAERIKGYASSEIIGKHFSIFYLAEEVENRKPERELRIARETGKIEDEGWRIRKDGSRFWANIIVTAIREKQDGEIKGFLKITRDLTQRRKAAERFKLVVESAPNAMILVNKDGIITLINRQTERLFGYERAELIGSKLELLIPKRFQPNHPRHRHSFFSSPSVRSMGAGRDLFGMRKDGTEFSVEIGLNPIESDEGVVVLASIIDITERKKAEERFKLVVESAPNAMVLVNQDGVITLINRQTEVLFGYERNELIGKKIEILLPERFSRNHPEHRDHFFKTPQTRSMGAGRELFALRKDGSEVQVEIGLSPIDTAEGQLVLASIIDITERKMQEVTLKKQVELEIKNKELEQFAYVASHDLQEPLRTVSNYMQIFEEDYLDQLDDTARKYIGSVNKATRRMSTLVKALLDFSRLGRNRKLVNVDCKKMINNVISDLQKMIVNSDAIVEVGEMPSLNLYEIEMSQLFQNLISNAIKFQHKGSRPAVHISSIRTNGKYQFSVQDNGIGIAPVHFKRIFDIFQRLHPVTEYEGDGIGLANCKRIVELHQGEIWVESTLGKGTTFNFTVPILTL